MQSYKSYEHAQVSMNEKKSLFSTITKCKLYYYTDRVAKRSLKIFSGFLKTNFFSRFFCIKLNLR